eukprot:scaffold3149_cov118-Isochrysis_galbana.AAC.4
MGRVHPRQAAGAAVSSNSDAIGKQCEFDTAPGSGEGEELRLRRHLREDELDAVPVTKPALAPLAQEQPVDKRAVLGEVFNPGLQPGAGARRLRAERRRRVARRLEARAVLGAVVGPSGHVQRRPPDPVKQPEVST